jgi:predicted AlkP superfamily pyrophosphatase or phosphodiesterase
MISRPPPALFLVLCLLAAAAASPLPAASKPPLRPLLLISIDGLRPDYVLEADRHGLNIPHLRRIVQEGTHAAGVRGVLPTATYPSHTTLITGVAPARHGIYANKPFGRHVKGLDIWYVYTEDIRVPTLWDAAAQGGMIVGSVSWPVSVGASSITYNIPEYNLTRTAEDVRITRGAATPGLMAEIEPVAGPYLTDVDRTLQRDQARTRYALEMIRRKQTQFMTVHLTAPDTLQHRHGPFTDPLFKALEDVDRLVGELVAAIRTLDPRAGVCVVSDHGFSKVERVLWLDAAFVKEGLVTLSTRGNTIDESTVSDWIARAWLAGGSAAIVLKNPQDATARARVKAFLEQLAANPENGIAGILDEQAIARMGGTPTAQYWVTLRPGYMMNATLNPSIVSVVSARGTHGYAPDQPDMNSTFLLAGDGVRRNRNLGVVDMRSIAPTLARFMGVPLPTAEMPALDVFEKAK